MIVSKYKAINTCAKSYSDRSFDVQSLTVVPPICRARVYPCGGITRGLHQIPPHLHVQHQFSRLRLGQRGRVAIICLPAGEGKAWKKNFKISYLLEKFRPHFPLYFLLYKQIYQIYAESGFNISINRNSFYKITKIQ